jgi:hypothetical protein
MQRQQTHVGESHGSNDQSASNLTVRAWKDLRVIFPASGHGILLLGPASHIDILVFDSDPERRKVSGDSHYFVRATEARVPACLELAHRELLFLLLCPSKKKFVT